MSLDLNAVMDAIGTRLATVTGLRVYDYPADSAAPPAAIVAMPTEVEYDFTKARATDRAVIPVTVLVGKVSDRASRDALSGYLVGAGASSIKGAIDGTLGDVAETARVMLARIEVVTLNAVEYLGATFDVEVID